MTERIFYEGSIEYLDVPVTCDVELDAQPVEISFDRRTWYAAEWTGAPGTTRTARLLLEPSNTPPKGERTTYVRITDSPEIPIFSAGKLLVR